MLIRFIVNNFMSFKEDTEFNMLPIKGNGSRKLQNHIHETGSGIEVLKTAAIYGANAAGKSNLIKAIAYLREIILGRETILMPQSKRFRIDSEYKNKPTTFRLEIEHKLHHFDYGIEIHKGKIQQEWLYLINSVDKKNEETLIVRENKNITFGEYFDRSQDLSYIKKYLKKELKETQSIINACYGNIEDEDVLDIFFGAVENLNVVMPSYKSIRYSESILVGDKSVDFARNLLLNSSTGIEDLIVNEIEADNFFSYGEIDEKKELIEDLENYIESTKDQEDYDDEDEACLTFHKNSQLYVLRKKDESYIVSFLKTKHSLTNDLFDLHEESDGTNRLFELAPAFEELILEGDVVYIVDEMERSMHPLLAKQLLKMFSSSKTRSSQLIFTTHESHLLDNDLLRRDEIWFTEKKHDGSTEFYPLSNFNPRGDKVLQRGYLEGRYGGIPFLGDFNKIITEN